MNVRRRRSKWWPALGAAVAVLALVLPALARPKPAPTLAGLWRLDPSRTETPIHGGAGRPMMPGGFGGHGGWGGGMGGGRGGGGQGSPDGEGSGSAGGLRGLGGVRPAPLPPLMRITQRESLVTLADTSGVTVAEIAIGDTASADSTVRVFSAPHFTGAWQGDHLVVVRELARGVVVTDTWTLKSKGSELEIRSSVKPHGDRPGLEFKRVYTRAEG